jgi:hypothetical protein
VRLPLLVVVLVVQLSQDLSRFHRLEDGARRGCCSETGHVEELAADH